MLTSQEMIEERELKATVNYLEAQLSKLESNKKGYTFMADSGATTQIYPEEALKQIEDKRRELERAKRNLAAFYDRVGKKVREVNLNAKDKKEQKKEEEAKLESYYEAKDRWKSRNVIYKLFHQKTSPKNIMENFDNMTKDEIDDLYRKR